MNITIRKNYNMENFKISDEQKLNSFLHGIESDISFNYNKNLNKIEDSEEFILEDNPNYLNQQRVLFKNKFFFQNDELLKDHLYEINYLEEKFDFRESTLDPQKENLNIGVVDIFIKNKYPSDIEKNLKITLFIITRLLTPQEQKDPFNSLFINFSDPDYIHNFELLVSSDLDFSNAKSYFVKISNLYLLGIKESNLFEHLIKNQTNEDCSSFFSDICDLLEPFLYQKNFISKSLKLETSLKKKLDNLKTSEKETIFDFVNFDLLLGDDETFLKNIFIDEFWELNNNIFFESFGRRNNLNIEILDKNWEEDFLKKFDFLDEMFVDNKFNHFYFYCFFTESIFVDSDEIKKKKKYEYNPETDTFEENDFFLIDYSYIEKKFNISFAYFKKSFDYFEFYYNEYDTFDKRNNKWYFCDPDFSNFQYKWDYLRIEQFEEFYPTFEKIGDEDLNETIFFTDHFSFLENDSQDDDFFIYENEYTNILNKKSSTPFLFELENLLFTKSKNLKRDVENYRTNLSYGYSSYSFFQESETSIAFKELNLITEEEFQGKLVFEDYSSNNIVRNFFFKEKNSYFTIIYNLEHRWPTKAELIDFISDPWCQILSRYWTKPRPSTIFLFGFWCLSDPSVINHETNSERLMFLEYLNFTLADYMEYPLSLIYNDYLRSLRESLYIEDSSYENDVDTSILLLLHSHYSGEKIFFDYLEGFDGYYIPGFFWNEWHFKITDEENQKKKSQFKKKLLDNLDNKKKKLILSYPFDTKTNYVDENFYSSFYSLSSFEKPEKTDIYYYGFLINKKYKHFSFFEFERFRKDFKFCMPLKKEKENIYLSINNSSYFKNKHIFLKNNYKFKKMIWLTFFFSFFFSSVIDFISSGVGSFDTNSLTLSITPTLDLKKKNLNLNFFFEFLSKSTIFGGSLNLTLLDIWGVDYIERKKFRFEVNYYFLNLFNNFKFYFKFSVSQFFLVQSISKNFSSANWLEREVFDMFGVIFLENKDLRRILTDYGFKNNPLKKDYPLVGFYQIRYNDVLKTIVMEKINLMQELRLFNFSSPWIVDQEGVKIKVE